MKLVIAIFSLFCNFLIVKELVGEPESNCQDDYFKCSNLKCIPVHFKCDNSNDCGDNSDESDCKEKDVTCLPDKFKCLNGLECIDHHWICDNHSDCSDSSDEKNCSYSRVNITCTNDEYTCQNKRCIPSGWLCDKNNDCGDNSDELNCHNKTLHTPECSDGLWKCHSGECIKSKWKCDFKDDCTDKSDEIGCDLLLCDHNNFKCKHGEQCLLPKYRCDGLLDCTDGSDEDDCDTVSEICTTNHFKCSDNKTCIDWKNVCDKKSDCPNGEDESNSCYINECEHNNGHCNHICTNLKIGYVCSCKPGYTLSNDGRTCEDINECEIHGTCHQICHNTNGSYYCSCTENFVMQLDKVSCKTSVEGWIYFANRRDIRKFSLSGHEYDIAVNGLEGAVSIDFDVHNNFIYWTDVVQETINRAIIGSNQMRPEILVKNTHTSDGLAVDWLTGKLYWTDAGYKTIEVADLSGKNNADLVTIDLLEPRAISLDPFEGLIYWSDWGDSAVISRISMDGNKETRKSIVDKDIIWPNGLTLDLIQRKLYWICAKLKRLEVIDFDGKNRKLLRMLGEMHPFSLDGFQDQLYFSDWKISSIDSLSKYNLSQNFLPLKSGLFAPMDVKVFHPARQPLGVNPCDFNNTCSHLCLLGNDGKKRIISCKCPRGMYLNQTVCMGTPIIRTSINVLELTTQATTQKSTQKSTQITTLKVTQATAQAATQKKEKQSMSPALKFEKLKDKNVLITLPDAGPTLKTRFSKYKAAKISDGSYLAIFLSILVVIVIVLIFILIRRRREQNKSQVMYYKDMSTTPLEEDFYMENEEIDEKANIIYQDV
ncbi:low-density lipoprotein receptor 2 isoform X3 [Hydra vulgaris]|uniref:Low-density lipoprotein receptor 2 isoform X3 n=1 Tax=Hydra vulgaris TaxID=6087 RepID=A0ABM4D4Y9_HYDVU